MEANDANWKILDWDAFYGVYSTSKRKNMFYNNSSSQQLYRNLRKEGLSTEDAKQQVTMLTGDKPMAGLGDGGRLENIKRPKLPYFLGTKRKY